MVFLDWNKIAKLLPTSFLDSFMKKILKTYGKAFTVQSCKLFNNKYMITSTQITNTEIFTFLAVLVFELFSRKILFMKRENNGNC